MMKTPVFQKKKKRSTRGTRGPKIERKIEGVIARLIERETGGDLRKRGGLS
jgi:hypothetical protein